MGYILPLDSLAVRCLDSVHGLSSCPHGPSVIASRLKLLRFRCSSPCYELTDYLFAELSVLSDHFTLHGVEYDEYDLLCTWQFNHLVFALWQI